MDDGEDAVGLFFGEEGHGAAGLFKTEPEEDDEEGEDEDGADGFGIVFGLFDAAFFVAADVGESEESGDGGDEDEDADAGLDGVGNGVEGVVDVAEGKLGDDKGQGGGDGGDDEDVESVFEIEEALVGDLATGRETGFSEPVLSQEEDDDADAHSDGGGEESDFESEDLSEGAADEGGEEGADVDAHVEDGEGAVASWIFVFIEVPDDSGDVGLEKSVSEDEQCESEVQGTREHHGELAEHHDQAAGEDGFSGAEEFVGQETADKRGEVYEARVDGIDGEGVGSVHAHSAFGGGGGEV